MSKMRRPDFEATDPGFAERVRSSFDRQPMMRTLGVSIADLGPGWIELDIVHDDRLTQHHGYAHAGVLATAMDSACGYAALSLMPAEADVLTVEYKVNLLRPAQSPSYRAIATVTKPGRTLTVCQAVATAHDNDKPLATMTGTLMAMIDGS